MEARAVKKYIRISPRKLRLVADLVRGKGAEEAMNMLHFTRKNGAIHIEKTIHSAIANAIQANEKGRISADDFVVSEIQVSEGPTMRRFLPRAMGRATIIRKRTSHLSIKVSEKL